MVRYFGIGTRIALIIVILALALGDWALLFKLSGSIGLISLLVAVVFMGIFSNFLEIVALIIIFLIFITSVKNSTVKSQVYEKLTPGQKALFLFRVLYGHSKSIAEFLGIISLYFDKWPEFKNGIKYFGDNKMFQVYEEIERVYKAIDLKLVGHEILGKVLENDSKFFENAGQLYKTYIESFLQQFRGLVCLSATTLESS